MVITMSKQPAVYMLTNNRNGTLYIGVTSNLVQRIWQHKQEEVAGFSARYALHILVYFELHADMYTAISREKQLKKWNRAWKLRLIEEHNPDWRDLWPDII
ncbi:GIY-YIG nuclease family protein [Oceanisphaera sediminis]|uniref:GIY-YIG nuclease family protein n=2 Tax=Aeromonadaceae TaxID=84642 RepID=A0ABP7DIX6_9GAMM